jgi:hypothetical protein
MDRQVFGGVQNFRYLGTVINSENLISDGIKSRSAAGIRCFYSRRQIFSSRAMSEEVEIKMCKMMVNLVVVYWLCLKWIGKDCMHGGGKY